MKYNYINYILTIQGPVVRVIILKQEKKRKSLTASSESNIIQLFALTSQRSM